ncbi:MAG: hypothetical protein L3J04_00400 [Robiginitomaculum sp.]|nr:hypothetical protein [Robiginitomaculum sp.]
MIAESDFIITGKITKIGMTKDVNLKINCGEIYTVESVEILRESKNKFSRNVVSHKELFFHSNEIGSYRLEDTILIVGSFILAPRPKPKDNYIVDPRTSESIPFPCSEFLFPSTGYTAIFSSLIASYQIASNLEEEWLFDIVNVDKKYLLDISKEYFGINYQIAKGMKGWMLAGGRTIICLSAEPCAEEVRKLQIPVQNKDGSESIKLSGSEYLIEVDALLKVFDDR